MPAFDHASPQTLDDVFTQLTPGAALIAGGTDLVPRLQTGVATPTRVVDLKQVEGLAFIEVRTDGLWLGPLTRLVDLAEHPDVRARCAALAQSCRVAASPQLRQMGTLGGNLAQASRCVYYRGEFECLLKGGETCPARHGANREHAVFGYADDGCVHVLPSDLAIALAALGARARVRGPAGEREVRVADLYRAPTRADRRAHLIAPDELLTAVRIPDWRGTSIYLKAMDRAAWTFALVSVAIAFDLREGRAQDPRIVLGGVAARPWRAVGAEALLAGVSPSEGSARIAEAAAEGARPLGENGYKVALIRGLVSKALRALAERRA